MPGGNYKADIDVSLRVEPKSLAEMTKQIQDAIRKATGGGKLGAPGVGAGKSAAAAAGVSSKDFADAVSKAVKREVSGLTKGYEESQKRIEQLLTKIARTAEKTAQQAARPVPPPPRDPHEAQSRITDRAAKGTARAIAQQVESTHRNAGRREESVKVQPRTGKTGDPATDDIKRQLALAKRQQAKVPADPRAGRLAEQQRAAQAQAAQAAASLDALVKVLRTGSLAKIPDLAKRAGLPAREDIKVGEGAAVQMKTASGQIKILGGAIELFNREVKSATNIFSSTIDTMMKSPKFTQTVAEAERRGRYDPEGAINIIRRLIRGLSDLPTVKPGGMRAYQKGGEATIEWEITDERMLKELNKLRGNEGAQVAYLNKELWGMNDALKELRKTLGAEVVGSIGLSEEKAARAQIPRRELQIGDRLTLPVQLRDIAAMGVGGRGAVRPQRTKQPFGAYPIIGGEQPRTLGAGEKEAYNLGLFQREISRNLKTAFLDLTKTPEVHEDMILISKDAAKQMSTWVSGQTRAMAQAAGGLQVGQKLKGGEVLGYDVEGREIKFDLSGAEAEIEDIEEIVVNGVKAFRVRFKELYELMTGSKLTTMGGFKGVVRVEEDLTKFGAPKGADVAVSAYGMAKRGVLRDPMQAMAAEIADQSGASAQEVVERIEQAMMEGGKTFREAIISAAEAFGLKGFTGGAALPGGGTAMMGELPWYRLAEPRKQGPGEMGMKYYDRPAMRSLELRAETYGFAQDMQEQIAAVAVRARDMIATLEGMAGQIDVAREGLRTMVPEEFSRLPEDYSGLEALAGTILDPKFQEAMALRLPTKGGGEKLLRMTGMGKALGQRAAIEGEPGGLYAPTKVTRVYDQMLQTAKRIRMGEGRVPTTELGGDVEAQKEAYMAVKQRINALISEARASENVEEASQNAVRALMPLVETLEKFTEANMPRYYPSSAHKERGEAVLARKGLEGMAPAEFVGKHKGGMQQLYAIRDILVGRTAGPKGMNVPTAGEAASNVDLLEKAMGHLNLTLEKSEEEIDALYSRLDKLEGRLVTLLTEEVVGTAGGGKPLSRRRLAEQLGGGAAPGPVELTAVQMRTDVSRELAEARKQLELLGQAGGTVEGALEAVNRLVDAQGDVSAIPRDVVYLNKQDWDRLVKELSYRHGITEAEAEQRLQRPGLLHRYPTTGGMSFLAAQAMQDVTGQIAPGKIGVGGPMAVSSKADLEKVQGELRALETQLMETIAANRGQGDAAELARDRLAALVPVLEKLNQLYLSTGQNLDFDGDKISFLADAASDAGSGIETMSQKLERGAVSHQHMLLKAIGGVKGGAAPDVAGYGELFGQVVKGRPAAGRRDVLAELTDQQAAIEAEAHVGGKKTVGIFTDMFNSLMLAATHGSAQVGDAFATGIEYMMLNINKSLAVKGGDIGALGDPKQLVSDIQTGSLQKIFSGMEAAGEGLYGEMGRINKQYTANIRRSLEREFMMRGGTGLREYAGAQGVDVGALPKEISFENYKTVIDNIVEQVDLKSVIKRLYEGLRANMRKALQMEGLSADEIENEMATMLSAKGRAGGPPGLDIRRALQSLEPEYTMTRGATAGRVLESDPMQQAQAALSIIPSTLSSSLKGIAEELDVLDDEVNPRERARAIAAHAKAFLESISDTFEEMSVKDIVARGYTPEEASRVRGMRTREGKIGLSKEQVLDPFRDAIKELEAIAAGAPATEEALCRIRKSLAQLGTSHAHEQVHEANKRFAQGVNNITSALESASGPLAKDRELIEEAFSKSASIKRMRDYYDQAQQAADEAAAGLKQVVAVLREVGQTRGLRGTGMVDFIKEDPTFRELSADYEAKAGQARKQKQAYYRSIAEELMARQADPDFLAQMQGWKGRAGGRQFEAGLSGEAANFLAEEFENLRTSEAGELFDSSVKTARALSRAMVEGLQEGLPDERDVDEIRKMGQILGVDTGPGGMSPQQRLRKQEQALMQGMQSWGLRTPTGKGGRLVFEESVKDIPMSEELEVLNQQYKELVTQAREGYDSVDQMVDAQNKMNEIYQNMQQAYKRMEGPAEQGFQLARGQGFKIATERMVEFRSAMITSMINDARDLERAIKQAEAQGMHQTDPAAFSDLVKSFLRITTAINEYAAMTRGAGRGRGLGPFVTPQNLPVPAAVEAGVEASPDTLQGIMKQLSGRGEEGATFMKQFGTAIESIVDGVLAGEDATEGWVLLWKELIKYPQMLHTNLSKVSEILATAAGAIAAWKTGKFSEAANGLMQIVQFAKDINKEFKDFTPKSVEDIESRLAGDPTKRARRAYEAGRGMGVADSIEEQYAEAERVMKQYQQKLQKIVQTEGYKKAGMPKFFEPIKAEIVDPETQKVIQRITIEAKRMGKTVVTSMKQAGAATGQWSTQMRSAMRRVVQWGFASGVVYGMVRAFRNLVQVVTEVQTKIANLQKVMNVSITDFEAMQNQASDFAKTFGIAIEEVLDGMVVYAQQGLKMSEINERTRATLLAVNVTTLNATEATEALTAAHKVFGEAVDTSAGYVDAWASVAAHHAITAKDLALAVQRSGAAAKTAGVGFEDFMGIVTSIGAVTRQTGKEIATGTKFMFRAMRRPTAQKAMMRMGVMSQNAGGDLRPAVEVLGDLAGKWEGLTRAQKLNIAQAMAGIRHYNKFIVLMDNWQEAVDASIDAQNSQGFATQKNALAMKTFAKQMQVMREEMKRMALDVGKALLPIATVGIKSIQSLVSVVNKLPDVFKQSFALIGVGIISLTRGADLLLDTWDAMAGTQIGEKVGKKGIARSLMGVPKAIKGMFKGMGGVFGAGTGGFAFMGGLSKDAGIATKGVYKLVSAFKSLTIAGRMLALSGIGVVLAAIGGLVYVMSTLPKKGKEVEDELSTQIGKTMAAAEAQETHARQLGKLTTLYDKYQSTVKKMGTVAGAQEAFRAGEYKGPATMAKAYKDAVADVADALARIDPASIQGLSETGDYVMGIGDSFKYMATSAADAQKAIAAAMQVQVIKAYARELSEPASVWDKMKGYVGDFDNTVMKRLATTNKKVAELAKKRQEAAEAGREAPGLEQEWADAISKQIELKEQVLQKSLEIKRVLEEMPAFENMGLAATFLGPGTAKSIRPGVEAGQFGRGATVGSVMLKTLAKSAGVGKMMGYTEGASPARFMESFVQKGIAPQLGKAGGLFEMVKATGDMVQISKEAASALLQYNSAMGTTDEAITAARTGIVEVDKATGEKIIWFFNSVENTWMKASEDTWQAVTSGLEEQGQTAAVVLRHAMEEAAAETRRILTLQFVGAMAGIRKPEAAEIGPARFLEVGAPERMMGALPDEMQRFSDIMKQVQEQAKEINEDMSAEGLSSGSKNINALTEDMLSLIMDLQQEGFKLSVIAHYNQALQELNLTMEKGIDSLQKLEAQEKARFDVARHTTGALAGMAVMPQLQFGKKKQELTGLEFLQMRNPAVAGRVQRAGIAQQAQKQLENMAVETAGRLHDFTKMIDDMEASGQKLTKEQLERRRAMQERGLTKEQVEYINALRESGDEVADIAKAQLEVQGRILDTLQLQVKMGMESTPEGKRKAYMGALGEAPYKALKEAMGKVPGSAGALTKIRRQVMGIGETGETKFLTGRRQLGVIEGAGVGGQIKGEFAQDLFKMVQKEMADLEEHVGAFTARKEITGKGQSLITEYENRIDKLMQMLMGIPEVRGAIEKQMKGVLGQFAPKGPGAGAPEWTEEDFKKGVDEWRAALIEGERVAAEGIRRAALLAALTAERELTPLDIAENIGKFSLAVSNTIDGFKKAEALFYTKIDSDLEGAFARVGKPGFKTEFETRRSELEAKRMRPMTGADRRQYEKDMVAIEFDEKEARIKQEQDKEIAMLKQQQSQAEQLRSQIADAIFGGTFEGDPQAKQMARNFMDTLTEELATSEQAKMGRGGELTFQGLPSLERAGKFAEGLRQRAEAKAMEKQGSVYSQYITDPIVGVLRDHSKYLNIIAGNAQVGPGGAEGALPTVGRTAHNLEAERQARYFGLASATMSTISDAKGERQTPGTRTATADRATQRATDEGTKAQVDASQEIVDAVSALTQKVEDISSNLSGLSDVGDDMRTSAAGIVEMVDLLQSISSDGIDVPGLNGALDLIGDTFRSIGAKVTEVGLFQEQLEGVVGGRDSVPIDERIAEAQAVGKEAAVAEATDTLRSEMDANNEAVLNSAREEAAAAAEELVASLEEQQAEFQAMLEEARAAGDEQANSVAVLEIAINNIGTDLEAAREAAEEAHAKIGQTDDNVRTLNDQVERTKGDVSTIQTTVTEVRTKTAIAESNAKQALNVARQKRSN